MVCVSRTLSFFVVLQVFLTVIGEEKSFFTLSYLHCHPVNTHLHTENSSEQADTTLWVPQEHDCVLTIICAGLCNLN